MGSLFGWYWPVLARSDEMLSLGGFRRFVELAWPAAFTAVGASGCALFFLFGVEAFELEDEVRESGGGWRRESAGIDNVL